MVSGAKVLFLSMVVLSITTRADSTTISVDFSTPSTQENIGALYPSWQFVPADGSDQATVSVVNGQLQLGGNQASPTAFQFLTAPVGAFTIDLDLGAYPGNGGVNIGVQIGQNEIVFHPGYGGTGLRVQGSGGFENINVGFTLAAETLHHLTLTGNGLGAFNFTLTDGLDSSNTISKSFLNPASVGGVFAIRRAGTTDVYAQVYADNFVLTDQSVASVPDSSSTLMLSLLGFGSVGLCYRAGRQRHA